MNRFIYNRVEQCEIKQIIATSEELTALEDGLPSLVTHQHTRESDGIN